MQGEGTGGEMPSLDQRAKISKSLRGHECSQETRDKITATHARNAEIDSMTWSLETLEEAMGCSI